MNASEILKQFADRSPRAARLAQLVSLAARIEPALLRAARLELFPEADAGDEADLWLSELVQIRTSEAIVLDPEVGVILREQLGAERIQLDKCYDLLKRVHEPLPSLLRLEERIIWLALRGDLAEVQADFDAVLRTMAQQPEKERIDNDREQNLAYWALRAIPHLPAPAHRLLGAWLTILRADLRLGARVLPLGEPPPDLEPIDLRLALPENVTGGTIQVGLHRSPEGLRVCRDVLPDSQPIVLPSTEPLVLYVRAGDVRHVTVFTLGQLPVFIGLPSGPVQLATASGDEFLLRNANDERLPVASVTPSARPVYNQPASQTKIPAFGKTFIVNILHISDLHEGGQLESNIWQRRSVLSHAWQRNLDEIREHCAIDLICFTGDLAYRGRPAEYERVTDFVDATLQHLALGRDRLFVVPGNHDIDRTRSIDAWKELRNNLHRISNSDLSKWLAGGTLSLGLTKNLRDDILLRQGAFRSWLRHMDLGHQLPENSPHGRLGYRATVRLMDRPFDVHIIGLDSSWLSGDDQDDGALLLTEHQFVRLCTNGDGQTLSGLRLGLIHHPLKLLADGVACQDYLPEHLDLLLHGHLHVKKINCNERFRRGSAPDRHRWPVRGRALEYAITDLRSVTSNL